MLKAAADHGCHEDRQVEVDDLRDLAERCWALLPPKRRAEVLTLWRDNGVEEFLNVPRLESIPD